MPEDDGFIGLVGPFWSRSDETGTRYGFEARPRHANMIGAVQGGMIMTFADRGLGMLALEAAGKRPCVTISFETQFIGTGRIGSFIELSGQVIKATASLVFVRGLVTSGDTVVASCQGTWKLLKPGARVAASGDGG